VTVQILHVMFLTLKDGNHARTLQMHAITHNLACQATGGDFLDMFILKFLLVPRDSSG